MDSDLDLSHSHDTSWVGLAISRLGDAQNRPKCTKSEKNRHLWRARRPHALRQHKHNCHRWLASGSRNLFILFYFSFFIFSPTPKNRCSRSVSPPSPAAGGLPPSPHHTSPSALRAHHPVPLSGQSRGSGLGHHSQPLHSLHNGHAAHSPCTTSPSGSR